MVAIRREYGCVVDNGEITVRCGWHKKQNELRIRREKYHRAKEKNNENSNGVQSWNHNSKVGRNSP